MVENQIGIVGLGFVGKAIQASYRERNQLNRLETFDTKFQSVTDVGKAHVPGLGHTCNSLEELVGKTDIIYVCVPTPMMEDGSCDTSITESVLKQISECAPDGKIVVIKSTVVPGTTERFQAQFPNLALLFVPEFLTEANYVNDYLNQELMLIGVPQNSKVSLGHTVSAEQMRVVPNVGHCRIVDATVAELFKYTANIFLATKVSFANEIENVAAKLDINWNVMRELLVLDSRLGATHWKVPGPDGHRGFGGTCFPKDLAGLLHFAKTQDIQLPILKAVWNRNTIVDRPEKDWEQLKNRAVKG